MWSVTIVDELEHEYPLMFTHMTADEAEEEARRFIGELYSHIAGMTYVLTDECGPPYCPWYRPDYNGAY